MRHDGTLTCTRADFQLTALHRGSGLSPPGQSESDSVRGRAGRPQGRATKTICIGLHRRRLRRDGREWIAPRWRFDAMGGNLLLLSSARGLASCAGCAWTWTDAL